MFETGKRRFISEKFGNSAEYETYEEAYNHMMNISCGDWKEV